MIELTEKQVQQMFWDMKLRPTKSVERSWYEDSWTETQADMTAITAVVNAYLKTQEKK